MVLAYHLILSAYGFWLPNDPRGSWSTYVGSRKIYQFGPATKTTSRRSVAKAPHNLASRQQAKAALLRPPLLFTGTQARTIATSMGRFLHRNKIPCVAYAIMPDHIHLAIFRHTYSIEQSANLLKGAATRALLAEDLHPFQNVRASGQKIPHCFSQNAWAVYLDSHQDLLRAIAYINANPTKSKMKPQRWSFITPYPPLPIATPIL